MFWGPPLGGIKLGVKLKIGNKSSALCTNRTTPPPPRHFAALGGDGAGRPMSVLMLVWGRGVLRKPPQGLPVTCSWW